MITMSKRFVKKVTSRKENVSFHHSLPADSEGWQITVMKSRELCEWQILRLINNFEIALFE